MRTYIFPVLSEIVPVRSPGGFPSSFLERLLREQDIRVRKNINVHAVPPVLALLYRKPFSSLQDGLSEPRNLQAPLLEGALPNTMNGRGTDDRGGDAEGQPARYNCVVEIAVYSGHGEGCYSADVRDVGV